MTRMGTAITTACIVCATACIVCGAVLLALTFRAIDLTRFRDMWRRARQPPRERYALTRDDKAVIAEMERHLNNVGLSILNRKQEKP